jgi:hypothetical protein
MDEHQIPLRAYLDEKFRLLHTDLGEIKASIRSLSDGHNDLDKRTTRLEDQYQELCNEAERQSDFRRRLTLVMIPLATSVFGYLFLQLIESLR